MATVTKGWWMWFDSDLGTIRFRHGWQQLGEVDGSCVTKHFHTEVIRSAEADPRRRLSLHQRDQSYYEVVREYGEALGMVPAAK